MQFASNQPTQQAPQHQSSQQSNSNQNQSKFNSNRNMFSGTGTVTNIQGESGIIDEECYFYRQICVKGIMPKLGDRVLVEATTNHKNTSFKWQATRVQVLSSSSSNASMSSSNHNSSKSSNYSSSVQNVVRNGSPDNYKNRRVYSPPPRRSRSPRRRSRERSPKNNRDVVVSIWCFLCCEIFGILEQEIFE